MQELAVDARRQSLFIYELYKLLFLVAWEPKKSVIPQKLLALEGVQR